MDPEPDWSQVTTIAAVGNLILAATRVVRMNDIRVVVVVTRNGQVTTG
jgi:hypothetical protein